MKKHLGLLGLLLAAAIACRPAAAGILLTDNFSVPSGDSYTFNDTLAQTQGGPLATVTYNITNGFGWTSQHSNGGAMLVANSSNGSNGYGNVSLNHDFAVDANSANKPINVSFSIEEVSGYSDGSRWVQFNVGGGQNLPILDSGVGLGMIIRQNGGVNIFSAGSGQGAAAWTAGDLVSLTLSDTAGSGSAFNGNGSKAALSIGGTTVGTYTLSQLTSAYVNFSGYNYDSDFYGYDFGLGRFGNLSISTVPEIDPAGTGSVVALVTGALGLLERRRRGTA